MPPDTLTTLQGQIERITYLNDETSYTVVKVKVYGRRDLVTVIGHIVNPTPGEVPTTPGQYFMPMEKEKSRIKWFIDDFGGEENDPWVKDMVELAKGVLKEVH